MQANRSVVRNFFALASGEAVSRMIAFCTTVYLARVLGATHFGVIAFVLGIMLYLMRVADFAMEAVGSKEIAENPDEAEAIASCVLIARLKQAGILIPAAAALGLFLLSEAERSVLALYALTLIPIAGNVKWVFLGIEYTRPVGLFRVIGEVLSLVIVLLFVNGSERLWVVPIAQFASETFVSMMLIVALRLRGIRLRWRSDHDRVVPILKRACPILIQYLLGLVIYNSDLIFVRIFAPAASVGHYAAAYMLISFLSNIGLIYGLSLIPTITRMGANTRAELKLYHESLAQTFAVTLPVTCGGFLLAPQIIELGFGPAYSESILVLQVLMWSIPLSIYRNAPWAALIARGRRNLLLKATGLFRRSESRPECPSGIALWNDRGGHSNRGNGIPRRPLHAPLCRQGRLAVCLGEPLMAPRGRKRGNGRIFNLRAVPGYREYVCEIRGWNSRLCALDCTGRRPSIQKRPISRVECIKTPKAEKSGGILIFWERLFIDHVADAGKIGHGNGRRGFVRFGFRAEDFFGLLEHRTEVFRRVYANQLGVGLNHSSAIRRPGKARYFLENFIGDTLRHIFGSYFVIREIGVLFEFQTQLFD